MTSCDTSMPRASSVAVMSSYVSFTANNSAGSFADGTAVSATCYMLSSDSSACSTPSCAATHQNHDRTSVQDGSAASLGRVRSCTMMECNF